MNTIDKKIASSKIRDRNKLRWKIKEKREKIKNKCIIYIIYIPKKRISSSSKMCIKIHARMFLEID